MINKDKILKVDLYNDAGERVLSTRSVSFPRDFFKIRGWELVSIKSSGLPLLHKGDRLSAIFEYFNGTRVKCETKVDISTRDQLNFHVDEGIVLEERRSSFKVSTPDTHAYMIRIERSDDEVIDFEESFEVRILNINLSGILMRSTMGLKIGDIATLSMLDGEIKLRAEILRCQNNESGEPTDYGCKFLDVTHMQEERIARYIFDCQVAERERKRNSL